MDMMKNTSRITRKELVDDLFAESEVFDIAVTDLKGASMADKALADPIYNGDTYDNIHFAPASRRFSALSIPSLDNTSPADGNLHFHLPVFGFEKEEEGRRRVRENEDDFSILGLNIKDTTYDSSFVLGEMSSLWKLSQKREGDDQDQCEEGIDDGRPGVVELFENLRSDLVSKVGVMERFMRLQSMLAPKRRGVMPIFRILERCLVPKQTSVVEQLHDLGNSLVARMGPVSQLKQLQDSITPCMGPVEQLQQLHNTLTPSVGPVEQFKQLEKTLKPVGCIKRLASIDAGPVKRQKCLSSKLVSASGPVAHLKQLEDSLTSKSHSANVLLQDLIDMLAPKSSAVSVLEVLQRQLKSSSYASRGAVAELKWLETQLVSTSTNSPCDILRRLNSELSPIERESTVTQLRELQSQLTEKNGERHGAVSLLRILQSQLVTTLGPVAQIRHLKSQLVSSVGPVAQLDALQRQLCPAHSVKGALSTLNELENQLVSTTSNGTVTVLRHLESQLSPKKGAVAQLRDLEGQLQASKGPVKQINELLGMLSPRSVTAIFKTLESHLVSRSGGPVEQLEKLEESFGSRKGAEEQFKDLEGQLVCNGKNTVKAELSTQKPELDDDHIPAALLLSSRSTASSSIPEAISFVTNARKASIDSIPSAMSIASSITVAPRSESPRKILLRQKMSRLEPKQAPEVPDARKGTPDRKPIEPSASDENVDHDERVKSAEPIFKELPSAAPLPGVPSASLNVPRMSRNRKDSKLPAAASSIAPSSKSSGQPTFKKPYPKQSQLVKSEQSSETTEIPTPKPIGSSIPSPKAIGASNSSRKNSLTLNPTLRKASKTIKPQYFRIKCKLNDTNFSTGLLPKEVKTILKDEGLGKTNQLEYVLEKLRKKKRFVSDHVCWVDEDGDLISLKSDDDLATAIRLTEHLGKIKIVIQNE